MEPGDVFRFEVLGEAKPQGSKSAFAVTRFDPVQGRRVPVMREGRPVINQTDATKGTQSWRQDVAEAAALSYRPRWGLEVVEGAVLVQLTFFRVRKASDFRKDGTLRDGAKLYPDTWYDLDKLARAALDSMTGIVFSNDSRVYTLPLKKRYGPQAKLTVVVRRPRADTIGDLRRLRSEGDSWAASELEQLALAVA
jgi:Holliday junction resolvase RusA-like endonuclease